MKIVLTWRPLVSLADLCILGAGWFGHERDWGMVAALLVLAVCFRAINDAVDEVRDQREREERG